MNRIYNTTLNDCSLGKSVGFHSLESQSFPRPEPGTHIFLYLINRDKTHIVEWVLTSHCTKTLMQCLFFRHFLVLFLQFRLIGSLGSEIFVYISLGQLQKTLLKFKGPAIMLFTNRAYTKHQDVHDQESFRKSGLFRTPESSLLRANSTKNQTF